MMREQVDHGQLLSVWKWVGATSDSSQSVVFSDALRALFVSTSLSSRLADCHSAELLPCYSLRAVNHGIRSTTQ